MGAKAGNAYGLGAALGFASFFSSLGDNANGADLQNAVGSVGYARGYVAAFNHGGLYVNPGLLAGISTSEAGLYGNQLATAIYNQVVNARQGYAQILADHGLAQIYDLGLAIAIAEGELQVGSGPAANVGLSWLVQARTVALQLHHQFPFVNSTALNTASYSAVSTLRQQYQADFFASGT